MTKFNEGDLVKILLEGDKSVGASCLLLRYADNNFTESTISWIGTPFRVVNKNKLKMQIWEKPNIKPPKNRNFDIIRNVDALVVAFDLTNQTSFNYAKELVETYQRHCSNPEDKLILLVGCKKDLIKERKVSQKEIDTFAKEKKIAAHLVSAKNNDGVDELFHGIDEQLSLGNEVIKEKDILINKNDVWRNSSKYKNETRNLEKIWNDPINNTDKKKIISLLKYYTKNNSGIARIFSGHWRRHHSEQIAAVCLLSSNKSAEDIFGDITSLPLVNKQGSLATIIEFIEAKKIRFEGNLSCQRKYNN